MSVFIISDKIVEHLYSVLMKAYDEENEYWRLDEKGDLLSIDISIHDCRKVYNLYWDINNRLVIWAEKGMDMETMVSGVGDIIKEYQPKQYREGFLFHCIQIILMKMIDELEIVRRYHIVSQRCEELGFEVNESNVDISPLTKIELYMFSAMATFIDKDYVSRHDAIIGSVTSYFDIRFASTDDYESWLEWKRWYKGHQSEYHDVTMVWTEILENNISENEV